MIIICLFIGNNYVWYRILKKEQETIKNAIIPTLGNDYYQAQISLVKNAKKYPKEMEYEAENVSNYETNYTVKNVNLVNQNPDYPNGCEAASATMILNYYGIPISLQEFAEKYLMKEPVYEKDGMRFGPNPAIYYAGDPKDFSRGWGCFEPVIASAMQQVFNDYKLENKDINIEILRSDEKQPLSYYANLDIPIMIWTTIDYEEANEVYEWFSYDKKYTYTYPKNSHTVVVTGLDETYYYVNDSLKDQKNIPVKREMLERSFDSAGRQVVGIFLYDFSRGIDKIE